ncbi:MAG: hypothetical protein WKG00_29595 [Polyangiaceae bacterium]
MAWRSTPWDALDQASAPLASKRKRSSPCPGSPSALVATSKRARPSPPVSASPSRAPRSSSSTTGSPSRRVGASCKRRLCSLRSMRSEAMIDTVSSPRSMDSGADSKRSTVRARRSVPSSMGTSSSTAS